MGDSRDDEAAAMLRRWNLGKRASVPLAAMVLRVRARGDSPNIPRGMVRRVFSSTGLGSWDLLGEVTRRESFMDDHGITGLMGPLIERLCKGYSERRGWNRDGR